MPIGERGMNHTSELLLLCCVLLLPTIPGCFKEKISVQDDFESPNLSTIWSTDRMEHRSFHIQSNVVHTGKSAAKITLRTGDIVEASTHKDRSTERDELMETMNLYAVEGITYEYQFSLCLPDTFPVLPVRLVLAQWKQYCPIGACSEYSPIVALRYQSGKLFITLQTDSMRQKLWETKEEIRNRWLNFTFQIRFSRQGNGEVKAFLDGKELVDYHGVTSYAETYGILPIKNRYFFKMGLYRDRIPEPMCMYIDDYRKRKLGE
jgi:hypothetical protein